MDRRRVGEVDRPPRHGARARLMSRGWPAGAFPLVACVAIYAAGQLANFLFQVMLLKHFGFAAYGEIGLAHLLFLLVVFVGDLGYGSIFLREIPSAAHWEDAWRVALGHKLALTLALDAAVLTGWAAAYGADTAGFAYLAGTVPATLFSLASLSPPLLAEGRRVEAFLVQQAPWPAALLVWKVCGGEGASALAVGVAVSAGFAIQLLAGLAIRGRPRLLVPRFGRNGSMLRSAAKLSAMGIAGALHERLTPFLLARLAPDFLPVLLLLGHATNGVSGIVVQINRLLLPRVTTIAGRLWSHGLTTAMLIALAVGFQPLLLYLALDGQNGRSLFPELLLPAILGWSVATVSSFSSIELIGQRREGELARIVLLGFLASAVFQVAAAGLSSAQGVLWARALCICGAAIANLAACALVPGPAGLAIGSSLLLAASAADSPPVWAASALLLLVGLVARALGSAVLSRRPSLETGRAR